MAQTKPILAVSSIGLGAALLFVAMTIQRDRFAFTAQNSQSSHALTSATFELSVTAPAMQGPSAFSEDVPIIALEALEVLPEKPRRANARPPVNTESTEQAPVVCSPRWRELESGPAGRMVREIC